MELLRIVFSGLSAWNGDLVFDFSASQRVSTDAKFRLNRINEFVNTNPIIELAGLNASGKTTTLKLIRFVIGLLNGEKINQLQDRDLVERMLTGKPADLTVYFHCQEEFFVLKTRFGKENPEGSFAGDQLVILSEQLYPQNCRITKKNWKEDPESAGAQVYRIQADRKDAGFYLSRDISIAVGLVNQSGRKIQYYDDIEGLHYELLRRFEHFIPKVVGFIDPNIETLSLMRTEKPGTESWVLKLKNHPEEIMFYSASDISHFLSRGTVKGIILFLASISVMQNGGYILADELENSLNRKVVDCLLDLFLSHRTNKAGGTIVFTTHCPELLDILERNDAVYILSHANRISCDNLAALKTRNDGKKVSQIYIQNLLERPTAPSYRAYAELKKAIEDGR